MSVFADSSAIVKLYVDEQGASRVRDIAAMYVSELALVEIPAALWRKHRLGALPASDVAVLLRAFENDYLGMAGRLVPVAPRREVLEAAARAAGIHGLRAYDAVQLATAAVVREVDPECSGFVCFDHELLEAAVREGFEALP
jgi:predicted nucleic acid-binding protein